MVYSGLIEFVKDREQTPFGSYEGKYEGKTTEVGILAKKLLDDGVYVFDGHTWLVISPPLITRKEEIVRVQITAAELVLHKQTTYIAIARDYE